MNSAADILAQRASAGEGQQLMRLVLKTLPVSVVVTDREGNILLINDASKRMWGGVIESGRERWKQTKGYWHDTGERIQPTDWASVRAISDGETILNELIDIETYDGQRKTIRNSAAPVRNSEGLIVGAVIVNEDVTDSVRAEEALRRAEELFRAIVEDQTEMIVRWKPDGTRTFVNQAYCRMFGKSYDELVGTSFWPLVAEPYQERVLERIRSLTPDSPISMGLHESLSPDGKTRWTEWSDRAFFDEQGRQVELQSVGRDITERKRAEEALREANQRLRILSRRRAQIQEEERQRLARELHDQLGQLLSAAKINVQSASTLGEDSALDKKQSDAVRIVDSVLQEVRKISFALRPPVLDDLGLAPALRWMLSDLASSAGLKAEFVADSNLPRADAESETACYRVAVEAVTNSIRHAGARKIAMKLGKIDDAIQLRVRDDGRGFDLTMIERGVERERLGLTGMRERAFAVGGQLEIKSALGEGTEIIGCFPISSAPERR